MSNFRTKFDPHKEIDLDVLDQNQIKKMAWEWVVF